MHNRPHIHLYTPLDMAVALGFVVLLWNSILVVCRLCLSPLRHVPGPWYAAISDLWITIQVMRLRQCMAIEALLRQYGPVVRVGPNKIVFRDMGSARAVYREKRFPKGAMYKALLTNENDHAMSTLGHEAHSVRRRAYAAHYVPKNLALHQTEINDSVLQAVEILHQTNAQSSTDCLAFFRHMMIDIIVASTYGVRHVALHKYSTGVSDSLTNALADFPKRGILRSACPRWAWTLVCRIPNARWRLMCRSDRIMAKFVGERLSEMRTQKRLVEKTSGQKLPLLQRFIEHVYPSGEPMPTLDMISECMGHLVAGSDTTTTSLSYFLWELSRRPDVAFKLQQEVDEAMPDSKVIPDVAILSKLPYLNAFIREGLRVYSAVPSLLERVVDENDFTLLGYGIPLGTTVGTQGWSIHRDTEVFPSPEKFIPERWLEATDAERTRMNQHFMPFGIGDRVCGGQTLAMMVLRIVVVAIVRNFEVRAGEGTDEKSMEVRDAFTIFPAAMETLLVFHPRSLT